jgi:hypothetical protein
MELASGQPGLMIYYEAESPAVRASTSLSDEFSTDSQNHLSLDFSRSLHFKAQDNNEKYEVYFSKGNKTMNRENIYILTGN